MKVQRKYFSLTRSFFMVAVFLTMPTNGLALGEEADFEAIKFLPALNLIRSTKHHLTTEPAFLPNACK